MSPRLQVVVLVADDLAPELRVTVERSIEVALDKFLVAFGGELDFGDYAAGTSPPGHLVVTKSYAGPRRIGPRKRKARPS